MVYEENIMSVTGLDHFNIRAKDLDGMRDFFVDIIGLSEGDRPSFEFPGYWLYAGDAGAVIHLVDAERPRGYVSGHGEDDAVGTGVVDHLAFKGVDAPGLLAKLEEQNIEHTIRTLPNGAAKQIFVKGPEGVVIEVVYPTEA
jgi:catechol 2,3-dioxygenase-like lactoylglutathione lyase family enzyme